MQSKMAMVAYDKCSPEKCDSGICPAAKACKRRLMRQETLYERPMTDPFLCRACGDCVRACPAGAIRILTQ